jgi:hypothetical protein
MAYMAPGLESGCQREEQQRAPDQEKNTLFLCHMSEN